MNSPLPIGRIALLAAIVAACGRTRAAPGQVDTFAVYHAALDSFPPARSRSVRLSARTWAYSPGRGLGDTSALYREVLAETGNELRLLVDFDSANANTATICDCFRESGRITLVPDTLQPDATDLVVVSRVAFSRDRRRALVAVGYSCGPACSYDALYLVVRDDTGWHVERALLRGVSGWRQSNEALLLAAGAAEAAGGRLPPAAIIVNRRSRAPRR